MKPVRIAIDAAGGDLSAGTRVDAAVNALQLVPNLRVILTGNADELHRLLRSPKRSDSVLDRATVIDADSVVPMGLSGAELARFVIRERRSQRRTSIAAAMDQTQMGLADAVVSSGNTGGIWATGKQALGMLPGVDKAALIATLPTHKRGFVAIGDVGLDPNRSALDIAEATLLAGQYAKYAYGIKGRIRHALQSNGSEDGKGNQQVIDAARLLRSLPIDFAGNAEAGHILSGDVHAVGMDGFVGNVVLKWIEATLRFAKSAMSEEFRSDWKPIRAMNAFINWAINGRKLRRIKERMTSEENTAAPIIGLNGLVFKVHGGAGKEQFQAGIRQAAGIAQTGLLQALRTEVPPLIAQLKDLSRRQGVEK